MRRAASEIVTETKCQKYEETYPKGTSSEFNFLERKMKMVITTARLVHQYYRVVDSDPDGQDYHLKVHSFKMAVITKFENYYDPDDNPIVSLFQAMIKFEEQIIDLDFMGLENLANELQEVRNKIDANLRGVVSEITGQDVTKGIPYDIEFARHVSNMSKPAFVAWIESYQNKRKENPSKLR